MTAAVHTSAQERPSEPDMFAGTEAEPLHLELEIKGVLLRSAEVRTKVVGEDNRSVPVLCIDIRPESGLKRTIHVEQVFTEATRKLAEQKAADLKRGAHVAFQTVLTDMRITFPHVRSITRINQEH